LAELNKLSINDAADLELAMDTGLSLASLNKPMRKAAKSEGVRPFA